MSSEIRLPAESRTEFGKGASRRIRRAHLVPAVVYGHGEDPLHISLPGHETMLALKHRNAVVAIDLAGEEHLAYAKFVQRHAIKGEIEHVDFVTIRRGEKIQVDIPVLTTGTAQPDAVVTVEHNTITVLADAFTLPESVEVDIEDFEVGRQVLAKELTLPADVELVTDPDAMVINSTEVRAAAAEDDEEAAEGADSAAAAAEGAEDDAATESSSDES